MKNTDLVALIRAQKTVEKLKKKMRRNLSKLPAKYGFNNVGALIAALQEIEGDAGDGGKKRGRPAGSGKGRRKRGKVTDEVRQKVKELFEAKKTGAEVAAAVGLSLPTVQNIKKQLKLVKERQG